MRTSLTIILLVLSSLLAPYSVHAGDKATLPTPIWGVTNATDLNYRQSIFCERYFQVEYRGFSGWQHALSGLELHPILTVSKFFNYTRENGIDEDEPGLVVHILDDLAQRAGFTWRKSFAVSYGPGKNATWADILELYTEMFDISVDYWDKNSERMRRGVAFMDEWFNGNMILIEKIKPIEDDSKSKINYFNFLAPFEPTVWFVTLATCVVSGIIFQFLEYLHDEREDRSLSQWFWDHQYLSAINFTQQFLYEPVSPAGRLFGFSLAFWAMVMGATYTANLASFFVDQRREPPKLQDIDEAIRKQVKICTWRGTNADIYIRKRYPQAHPLIISKQTEYETYAALHTGECGVTVAAQATWEGYERDSMYNPDCDLEWVGRTVEDVSSAFAVKADPANKCTNLIRDVLNYHLLEMRTNDTLAALWNDYYESNPRKNDCVAGSELEDEDLEGRRLLLDDEKEVDTTITNDHGIFSVTRLLKGGGGGGANPAAAAASGVEDGGGGGDDESLSMSAMAGTFVLHAGFAGAAILLGLFNAWEARRERGKKGALQGWDSGQEGSLTLGSNHHNGNGYHSGLSADAYPVGGRVLATGSCNKDGKADVIPNGTVSEQLQVLHTTQERLSDRQEELARQMALVVNILTKLDEQASAPPEKTGLASLFSRP